MRSATAAVLYVLSATAIDAAEVAVVSRVDAVTVFPNGAEVTRVGKAKLERGEHTVLITDLPAQAVAASIRVEGKANGRLEIGSVDIRRVKLQRADSAAAAAERKLVEDEIERLRDQRAALMTLIETAQTQKTFITNLAELPKRPAGGNGGQLARQDDWTQILGLIGTSMTDVHRTTLETQFKVRETDRKLQDLERKLASLAPAPEERTEVKVFVGADAPLKADMAVHYQVPNASWTALYDARLVTGTKTAAPKLTLSRRASIQQRTGESWNEVVLALSTTRPAAGSAAPELFPVTVEIEPDRPPPRPMAPAPMTRSAPAGGAMTESMARDEMAKAAEVSPPPPPQQAQDRRSQVEAAPFQAVFSVHGRVTIPNTGEMKRVVIDEAELDPQLAVVTVPKVEAKAYLYAKTAMPRGAPYLPGPVSLFRDATFVGTGRLPLLSPGEEHELGFGSDDLVRVRYTIADEKRGESGILSSTRSDQRNYRVSIKNMHERAVALVVRDQIPVSQSQDVKVELSPSKTPPTKRDIDDKRGVLAWESKLEPDEEKIIEFGYKVSWPSGKNVVYGR